jgi:hypothetical protein
MSEGPHWFAPKKYGMGSGLPIAWQGWVLLALVLVIVIGSSLLFADKPAVVTAIILPVTAIFMLIAAKTTEGGWRWKWGDKE